MSDEDAKDVEKADQLGAADSEQDSSTLAAVEAKMTVLRDGSEENNDDDTSVVDDEKVDESESTDTDTKDDDSDDKKDDDSPILPSGHRRAALAHGYTNEEVDHYLQTKPDEAIARFEELFDDWQKENSRWSDRGRQLVAAGQQVSDEDGNKDKDKDKDKNVLSHYDTKALIEEHGNENLINALVAPLNIMIDQVNAVAEKLSSSEEFLRTTEQNALVDATQEFLISKEMESFREIYGVEIKDLTKEQVKNRMELFEQADIIATGAKDHGKDISVRSALERAHIIMSQGTRDEAIRKSIRESMKKRTKTTQSSHQHTSASDADQSVSEEELVKRTEARQRALRDKK